MQSGEMRAVFAAATQEELRRSERLNDDVRQNRLVRSPCLDTTGESGSTVSRPAPIQVAWGLTKEAVLSQGWARSKLVSTDTGL
jgi:hypothetical protein